MWRQGNNTRWYGRMKEKAYSFGYGGDGRLGHGVEEPEYVPRLITPTVGNKGLSHELISS